MFGKLLDLLGFSDDGEVVVTDYRERQRIGHLERLKDHGRISEPVERAGYDEAPPVEIGFEGQDEAEQALLSRKDRIYQPLPIVPGLIIVRGNDCVKLLEDLFGALRLGKLVLLDLQGIDVEGGQKVLNSLFEAARSMHGGFFRVDHSCVLISPVKGCVEEWALEGDEVEDIDG